MDLNTHVKSVIETMTCAVHNQRPYVIVSEGNTEIICCCIDFKIICLKKMGNILVNYKEGPAGKL